MVTYIYCLIDPIDNQVKYIGKTNNINNRLNTHIIDEFDNIIEKYNSITEFKKIKNLNEYKFNKLKNRINNIHIIKNILLKK